MQTNGEVQPTWQEGIMHTCKRQMYRAAGVICHAPVYSQGEVDHLVFSGAHPGGGVRNVSEANAMESYALTLVPQPPPAGRWVDGQV